MLVQMAKLPEKTRKSVEEITKQTTPNYYFSPVINQMLKTKSLSSPSKKFTFQKPTYLYPVTIKAGKNKLLNPRIKLLIDYDELLNDFGMEYFKTNSPDIASALDGINVIIGSYECITSWLQS